MTIRGLIDACLPGLSLESLVLDPCNCSTYYNISGFEYKLSCQAGQLFDHILNKCRRAEEVRSHDICKPSYPLSRCDASSKSFTDIIHCCHLHIAACDFPVPTGGYGVTQTFLSVSQTTETNTVVTPASDFPYNRKESVNIVILIMAILSGAVIMLMLLLLVRIFRGFVNQRRSGPSCSANNTDDASKGNVIVIYDDIEDNGEASCDIRQRLNPTESTLTNTMTRYEMHSNDSQGNSYCCPGELIGDEGAVGKTVPEGTLNYITPSCDIRQRSNPTESTLTIAMTRSEMHSNDSQGNSYCCPGELIRDEGAVGKNVPEGTLNYITPSCDIRQRSNRTESTLTNTMTCYEMHSNDSQDNSYCCPGELIRDEGAVGETVPEGTLNYITPVSEVNHGSVSNYQSQKCNARSEYSYADDTISFDHIRTESTYSYADPFED